MCKMCCKKKKLKTCGFNNKNLFSLLEKLISCKCKNTEDPNKSNEIEELKKKIDALEKELKNKLDKKCDKNDKIIEEKITEEKVTKEEVTKEEDKKDDGKKPKAEDPNK